MEKPGTVYILSGQDKCAVALNALPAGGEAVSVGAVRDLRLPCGAVPQGHKLALVALSPGDRIIKNGYAIGYAVRPIQAGEWIHTHNIRSFMQEE